MPIYEYLCRDCREKFEKLVLSRSSSEAVECPSCGGTVNEQLFSTFSAGGACGPGAAAGRFT